MSNLPEIPWNQLHDAFGPADAVADLLGRLEGTPPDDVEYAAWDEIWGRLCRDDEIYTATYAFTPHVVRLAQARPPEGRTMYLAFVGRVELIRRLKSQAADAAARVAPPIPAALEATYVEALNTARDLTLATLRHPSDVENFRYLTSVLAALSGHALFGALLGELDAVVCPQCKTPVDLRTPG